VVHVGRLALVRFGRPSLGHFRPSLDNKRLSSLLGLLTLISIATLVFIRQSGIMHAKTFSQVREASALFILIILIEFVIGIISGSVLGAIVNGLTQGTEAFGAIAPYLQEMILPVTGFFVVYLTIIVVFAGLFETIYYSPHNNVSFTTESLPLHRQPNFWDFASFSLRTILPESAVTQIEPNSLSTKALASAETIIGSGFLVVVFAALNAYLTPRFEKIGKPSGFLQTLTQDGSAIRVLVKESPLIVSKSGQGYYKTISEAIRNAEDGWCINVQPGYYTEDLIIDKRGLEIKGIRNKVIVQAVDGPCLRMATDKAKIYGLNLNGPVMNTGRQYPAVDVLQGELELDNCDITSRSFACVAVYAAKPNAKLWLKNCRIHDGTYVGILIDSNGQGVMEYCEIYENGQAGYMLQGMGS